MPSRQLIAVTAAVAETGATIDALAGAAGMSRKKASGAVGTGAAVAVAVAATSVVAFTGETGFTAATRVVPITSCLETSPA